METVQRKIVPLNAAYPRKRRVVAASEPEATAKPQSPRPSAEARVLGLEDILFKLPHLVWVTDQNGQCIYVNKTFEDFTGTSAKALMNASWTSFLHPDDVAKTTAAWLDSVRHKTAHQARYRFRRYDKTYRWMLARATLVENASDHANYWVGTNTDIHELYHCVDAAHKSRALEHAFAVSWLQDLRVPLKIMKVNAGLASGQAGQPERLAQSLKAVCKDVDRLDGMVACLLEEHTTQSDAPTIADTQTTDLSEIIRGAVEELTPVSQGRLVVDTIEPNIIGVWNKAALRQVLRSLVDNAMRYGRAAAPVKVSLARAQERVTLSVQNELPSTGERGPEPSSTIAASSGWGTGLPAVKRIADAHGGFVQVESSTSGQTVVRITLPICAVPT